MGAPGVGGNNNMMGGGGGGGGMMNLMGGGVNPMGGMNPMSGMNQMAGLNPMAGLNQLGGGLNLGGAGSGASFNIQFLSQLGIDIANITNQVFVANVSDSFYTIPVFHNVYVS